MAPRAVEQAASQLAAIVEASEDAIIGTDPRGTITSWNPAAEQLYGYAPAEAIGRSLSLILPADRLFEEEAVLRRVRAGELVRHVETVRRRKDGTDVLVALTVSPVRTPDGEVSGMVWLACDMGRRQRADRAAWRLAAIVASSDDAIVSKDLDGIVTSWNRAAERMFGYTAEEMIGQSIRTIVPHDRQTEEDDVLACVKRGEKVDHFDTVRQRKDGSLVPISLTVSPIVDEQGTVIGASKVARDISERKQAETARARLLELAQENTRITDALNQEIQEASRLKDEFLATLSHELRTPLNALLGYTRMIRSGVIAVEGQARAVETIERNAISLSQIVEDILDVSRIISGKIRLNVQPVDLSVVVRSALEAMMPAADAKGITLDAALDRCAAQITGDPERLQQVAWNLITNAVKFTPRGGTVQVRIERTDAHIELVVSDTGIGIRPDFLPHVFERFRQADAGGTNRERGGLGLGLNIARQLVELHGGTIEATSAGEGQGTTFRVMLPL